MDGYTLHIVLGPAAGAQIDVQDELLIGRRADGPGRLGDDPDLSRRHALIAFADGQLTIVDLGSMNGTRINGRPISGRVELHAGDRIAVGASVIEVRGTAAPGVAVAPPGAARASDAAVPPLALPPVDRRDGREGRTSYVAALAALAGAAVATAVVLVATGGTSSSVPSPYDGTVYVETNVAKPDSNSILALRYRNGSFRPLQITEYPTAGAGSHDLSNRGVLDADAQVVANPAGTLLFAVNQGSDSIAVFHVADDGDLTPVRGSPFPSGGTAPTSLALSGSILVVANKALDGVRNLTKVQPNYTTFRVAADGSLHRTGSTFVLRPESAPIQVSVGRDGRLVFASEESGVMRVFRLSASGDLIEAPGSPQGLPNSLFARHQRPHVVWPAGLSENPDADILYSGVPNYGTIVAYDFDSSGQLTLDGEEDDPNAFLPCWSVVSANGRYLYFANAGTDNVSVWDIATDPRQPRLLQTVSLRGGGNPWNLGLDPNGRYLYIITPRQVALVVPAGQGQLLHSLAIAPNGTLTEMPSSPIPLPVALNTNPFGMAIVPRR